VLVKTTSAVRALGTTIWNCDDRCRVKFAIFALIFIRVLIRALFAYFSIILELLIYPVCIYRNELNYNSHLDLLTFIQRYEYPDIHFQGMYLAFVNVR